MKKMFFTYITAWLIALPFTSYAQLHHNQEQTMKSKKILVAFFSRTGENYAVGHIEKGNTHIVADIIADETKGELFRIEPVTPYPEHYTECTEVAKQELNDKCRPAILHDKTVEDYDIIFIGYPNWWGDMPMPVYTFIEKHIWQGKTVIPFCTHEGSGLSSTETKLKNACKGATVLNGLAIRGTTAQQKQEQTKRTVKEWLSNLSL